MECSETCQPHSVEAVLGDKERQGRGAMVRVIRRPYGRLRRQAAAWAVCVPRVENPLTSHISSASGQGMRKIREECRLNDDVV